VTLPANLEVSDFAAAGTRVFFKTRSFGDANWGGVDIWTTDGTAPGTRALTAIAAQRDIAPQFVELDGRVFFRFAPGVDGPVEIWSTDGSPAGTAAAIHPAAAGFDEPQALQAAADRLLFAARRAGDPQGELLPWASDGTDGGTRPLAPVALSLRGILFQQPVYAENAGLVFFAAQDALHGQELWRTDGTPEGTALVADIAPGRLPSYPGALTRWRDRLYFRATEQIHGMELWTTDGTAEGTRRVEDISPGTSWSEPRELTATSDRLYFSAHDDRRGRELWELLPD
jgi:ELWxxDGT repeat protein